MKRIILILMMGVFTTAFTTNAFAQKSTTKNSTSNKITRYSNSNIKPATNSKTTPTNKKQNIKKIKPKPAPGRKPKAVVKSKKN